MVLSAHIRNVLSKRETIQSSVYTELSKEIGKEQSIGEDRPSVPGG